MDKLNHAQLAKVTSIQPGVVVDMQIETPTSSKRVKTEFVGIYTSKYIILKYPDPRKWGAMQDIVQDGKKVVVRYILEDESGEIIAFRSKISSVVGHPVKMVFLDFPEAIESLPLRTQPRIKTLVAAKLDVEGKSYDGIVVDVSLSGCGFVINTEQSIPDLNGAEAKLTLNTTASQPAQFSGKICNQKNNRFLHSIGFQFDEQDAGVKEFFDKLLIDVNLLDNGQN